MQFFCFETGEARKDGTRAIRPRFYETASMTDRGVRTWHSKKQAVVFEGYADSGKTKRLAKWRSNAPEIWPKRNLIDIDALLPMTMWGTVVKGKSGAEHQLTLLEQAKGAVLFIDNAEKLTGRKLAQLLKMIGASHNFVLATTSLNNCDPALRQTILRKKPRMVQLKTKVSYDGTGGLMVVLGGLLALMGFTDIALLTGVGTIIARSRGGAK